MLCNMWGPGKFLLGEDASAVHDTILVLENVQQVVMRFFLLGLMCYFA